MNDQALQAVYRSVVISKLLNAACSWWGFTTADDRNRIEAVVRRGALAGQYPVDGPAAAQLVEDSDDVLFSRIQNSAHHVLHELLLHTKTPRHGYKLRPRRHNLSLTYHWDQRTPLHFSKRPDRHSPFT